MTWTRWLLENLFTKTVKEIKHETRQEADRLWHELTGQDLYAVLAKREQAQRLERARKEANLKRIG